ncbi:MAG: UDP-N-acetylglucosamine 2-epimerase (non-hydrolyzing) [Ignavibacteriae bacterium]|nr:UDP-N-acetylglucosamine 2-epimerase (non-hydrolyzing) [Ignavibacteriota bacterium]NOG97547.1 UDP-N-acetylglucosamine 2-epimerase (non-hydrolyzing) [Ignavibacteriota bacterium]
MKKILVIFGTRPEAIKLAPVIAELKKQKTLITKVYSTGQHREMLKQVLDIFNLSIDKDLKLMKPNQDLFDITMNAMGALKKVYLKEKPDLVIVQGDTSTAFISALAAFYLKIKVAHVEAGLRSYNIYSPFPEEANRRFISVVAEYNFAPTHDAEKQLLKEGFPKSKIFYTGNTVVDALLQMKKVFKSNELKTKLKDDYTKALGKDFFDKKYILITMHRREKFGDELKSVLQTIKSLAEKYSDYNFVYPVHLNPNVKKPVEQILGKCSNIKLIPPQDYIKFIYLMSNCWFIMSDSGGVQEECFVFKKPILVLRDTTERMEAVKAGYAFMVGSDPKKIKNKFSFVDNKLKSKFDFFNVKNPFGDGKASQRITKLLKSM